MRVLINVDGGSRGNPGPAAGGFVVRAADDGTVLREGGVFLGVATNNVAEYNGLLAGLKAAAELGATQVEVASDSELLVRQLNGQYRVKNDKLKPLFAQALALKQKFAQCTFRHVYREENSHADRLANRAMDARRNVDGELD